MDVYINDKKVDFAQRQRVTINDLIEQLEVGHPDEDIAIEVNGQKVNKAQWLEQGVSEDDRINIKVKED